MGRRLPDSVEFFSRKFREIRTFVKNPGAILRMQAWKRARSIYENTELPGGEDKKETQDKDNENGDRPPFSDESSSNVNQTEINQNGRVGEFVSSDSGNLDHSFDHSEAVNPSDWQSPSVPPLEEGAKLRGSLWYEYKIGKLIREEPYGQ